MTDTEAPNADGHHPLPASHDFHPRNGENVLLEDLINSEGMKLEVIYANGYLHTLSSNVRPYNASPFFRH